MKKIAALALIIILVPLIVFAFWFFSDTRSLLTGRALWCENGACLIIDDNGSPINMNTDRDIFKSIDTGDRIFIISDGINESYPGQTRAYICVKLEEGDISDINKDTLDSLQELGWYTKQK